MECTVKLNDPLQKSRIDEYVNFLCSSSNSREINKAIIPDSGSKKKLNGKLVTNKVQQLWDNLETFDPRNINYKALPKVEISLSRIAESDKSSLNKYFAKEERIKKD